MESDIIEELEALQSIYSPDEVDVALDTDRPATVTLKVDKQPVVTFLLSCKYSVNSSVCIAAWILDVLVQASMIGIGDSSST